MTRGERTGQELEAGRSKIPQVSHKKLERGSAQIFPTLFSTGMTLTRGDCKLTLEQAQLLVFLQDAGHPALPAHSTEEADDGSSFPPPIPIYFLSQETQHM